MVSRRPLNLALARRVARVGRLDRRELRRGVFSGRCAVNRSKLDRQAAAADPELPSRVLGGTHHAASFKAIVRVEAAAVRLNLLMFPPHNHMTGPPAEIAAASAVWHHSVANRQTVIRSRILRQFMPRREPVQRASYDRAANRRAIATSSKLTSKSARGHDNDRRATTRAAVGGADEAGGDCRSAAAANPKAEPQAIPLQGLGRGHTSRNQTPVAASVANSVGHLRRQTSVRHRRSWRSMPRSPRANRLKNF